MEFKIKNPDIAKTKKAFTAAVKAGQVVIVRNVSDMFEASFTGDLCTAPNGRHIAVGPDPYTKRTWFASVQIQDGKVSVL